MKHIIKITALYFSFFTFFYIQSTDFNPKLTKAVTSVGKQWLMIIAINKYREWSNLQNPLNDAEELKKVLTSRYQFHEIITLNNEQATKKNIITNFFWLQQKVKINDSVLIYFAGHGYYDKMTSNGYLIPADGVKDTFSQKNWIPNSVLRGLISNINAKHIFLVSDSCYSGDILNLSRGEEEITDTENRNKQNYNNPHQMLDVHELNDTNKSGKSAIIINNDYFRRVYSRISRLVLTSGVSESVPDQSEFTRLIIQTLKRNQSPYLDPHMLYNEIRLSMEVTTPLLGYIRDAGHQDGGSYLFFLKKEPDSPTTESENEIPLVTLEKYIRKYSTDLNSNEAFDLTRELITNIIIEAEKCQYESIIKLGTEAVKEVNTKKSYFEKKIIKELEKIMLKFPTSPQKGLEQINKQRKKVLNTYSIFPLLDKKIAEIERKFRQATENKLDKHPGKSSNSKQNKFPFEKPNQNPVNKNQIDTKLTQLQISGVASSVVGGISLLTGTGLLVGSLAYNYYLDNEYVGYDNYIRGKNTSDALFYGSMVCLSNGIIGISVSIPLFVYKKKN